MYRLSTWSIMHDAAILNYWCIQLSSFTRHCMAATIIISCQPCTSASLNFMFRHAMHLIRQSFTFAQYTPKRVPYRCISHWRSRCTPQPISLAKDVGSKDYFIEYEIALVNHFQTLKAFLLPELDLVVCVALDALYYRYIDLFISTYKRCDKGKREEKCLIDSFCFEQWCVSTSLFVVWSCQLRRKADGTCFAGSGWANICYPVTEIVKDNYSAYKRCPLCLSQMIIFDCSWQLKQGKMLSQEKRYMILEQRWPSTRFCFICKVDQMFRADHSWWSWFPWWCDRFGCRASQCS